jgi:hypothetical protein
MIFVTLAEETLRLHEDDPDASKHVGALIIYKILLIYMHIYYTIYIYI